MPQQPFDLSSVPRDSRRVPIAAQVTFKFERFAGFISEYSANISPTGMYITTNKPEPPGSVLDFEFQLGDGFEIIQGKGEVVWIRAVSEGPSRPAGMGIRFLELSEGSKELIYRIVDQYIQDGGTPFDVSLRPPDPVQPIPISEAAIPFPDLPD
ncbi:MAG TPA: TIGR02266 family protein [Thermoanaerobaculia bacterium]|nr:TIGR02266 family protein [Thermoanaerobaculia bacterium]